MKMIAFTSLAAAALGALLTGFALAPKDQPKGTPPELVAAYSSLADVILSAKKSEHDLVAAILAGAYHHAEGKVAQITAKLGTGEAIGPDVEMLAALIAQLGTEGDNAVAGVRKRLIDGGHHHHADGEAKGIYDEGFVIVTRAAKKALLESATAIAALGTKATPDALNAEWAKVKAAYEPLVKTK